MAYRTRIYYTDAQKAEMWDRWQRGESLHAIAQLFDRGIHRFNVSWPRPAGYARPSAGVPVLH